MSERRTGAVRLGSRLWLGGVRRPSPARRVPFVCVVDPGSTVVRVLVVAAGRDQPTIWAWHEGKVDEDAGASRFLPPRGLEAALDRAEESAKAVAEDWRAADQLVVGLPAEQLRSRRCSLVQRRAQRDRPIEERELQALLSRTLRLAVNHLRGDAERDWVLVDAALVAFTVDGRGVTDPVGFRGAEIGASVFAAVTRTEAVVAWHQTAERLSFAGLTLTAAPLVLAACLTDVQGMLVDIGGEGTSLTWWRAGKPFASGFFPVGGRVLTELLLRKWGISPERAEILKRAFADRRLSAEAGTQVLEVLKPGMQVWLERLEAALLELRDAADEPLPHRICLCGGGSMLPEMAEAARSLVWSQRLTFDRYPEIDRLQPSELRGLVNRTPMGHSSGDVAALALVAWIGQQGSPPTRPVRILRELCEE